MSKFERKFGKYAIPNLTLILIICYVVGYVAELLKPELIYTLALNPERILHGQVWRLLTWILIPPESLDFFAIIMLFFYYWIGTTLERAIGTYRYNTYIFGGILLTIIFAFAVYVVIYCKPEMMSGMIQVTLPDSERDRLLNMAFADQTWFFRKFIPQFFENYAVFFTTYYMNIAIAMAGALLFPDAEVLFMMFIPMKLKILGLIDLLFMLYYFFRGDIITKFAVAAALLNFFFFYTSYRKFSHPKPAQIRRRAMYQHKVQQAQALTKHKCAICGRTEETDPNMEFRYCSKCEGNYEYCSEHLYTHTHVKSGKN